MNRGKYQKITKNTKERRYILKLRREGNSDKEIQKIMLAKTNVKIPKQTIQSIKNEKRKTKYGAYIRNARSFIFSYIQYDQNHILHITDLKYLRKLVSELVKNKFPQPNSQFYSRAHSKCLNKILKKVKLIQEQQYLQQNQNDEEFNNYLIETFSEYFRQSPLQCQLMKMEENSFEEERNFDLRLF